MDSVSQIILGAAVGEAVLGNKVGNKAMLYGAIAGTIPDLDMFAAYFTDTVSALEIHRGFSHSIVFSVLFAPVFGWIISKIERKSNATWKEWSWLMFWGLFTHPILDSFTTWGTQLFWPLDIRLEFRSIFVIDPLYTVPFLIFLILAMRSKKGSNKRRKYNNLGLIISSGYLLLTLGLKALGYQEFRKALEKQNIAYREILTRPSPFNTILWNANIEVEDAFLLGDYSFFDSRPIHFDRFPKNHHLLGELRSRDKVQRLIDLSKGWFTITQREGELIFNDLRFGVMDPTAEDPAFVFSYRLLEENGEIKVEEVERNSRDGKKILSFLMERIPGN